MLFDNHSRYISSYKHPKTKPCLLINLQKTDASGCLHRDTPFAQIKAINSRDYIAQIDSKYTVKATEVFLKEKATQGCQISENDKSETLESEAFGR